MRTTLTLLKTAVCVAFSFGLATFCEYKTQGFRYYHLRSNIPNRLSWDIPTPPIESITPLLTQEFSYLSQGDQSYVFIGQDQKTILKFFKHDHLSPIQLVKKLPLGEKSIHLLHLKVRSLDPVLESVKIAYESLQEETGLLYVHLNKTENTLPTINLIGPLGIRYQIALDSTEFALQQKGTLLFPHIKKLLINQQIPEAKHHIRQLMQSLSCRCDKGIRNVDHSAHRNIGQINGRIMELDIGSYIIDPSVKEETGKTIELLGHTQRIKRWLKKYSPELLTFYESQIHYWATRAPNQDRGKDREALLLESPQQSPQG